MFERIKEERVLVLCFIKYQFKPGKTASFYQPHVIVSVIIVYATALTNRKFHVSLFFLMAPFKFYSHHIFLASRTEIKSLQILFEERMCL